MAEHANRLIHETSPYLLQHAHNPVDWYPWGDEAFAEARRRDVPIFLSIGYATCYWCHVMERESFENEAVAALMNRLFVCVKVDREERPDVDDLYMAATQALSGRGGWPMSVFLEPHRLRPFWAGTYYPPEPRHGLPGFTQILQAVADAWKNRRDEVLRQAEAVAEAAEAHLAATAEPRVVSAAQATQATTALLTMYDRVRGGFGGAPKFPQPVFLEMLLQVRPHAGDESTRAAVEAALRHTLDRMAVGGLFDQVGGGVHRYCVDADWTVPHFEKMLYDNAQLASLYARAGVAFGDEFYSRIARRTLDYILREMTSDRGAFYSAQDAEVDGREGLNYLWTRDEIADALPADDAALVAGVYGLDAGPNFRDPHHPDEPPRHVLRLADRPEAVARATGLSPEALRERLDRANAILLEVRSKREPPRTDDKIIAGWNGLMIGALAAAGSALPEPRYTRAAEAAASFILQTLRDERGGLLRTYRDGRARIPAFLEDYALLIHGLLALHRAAPGAGAPHLAAALELLAQAEARFADGRGGYHDTLAEQTDLFVRPRTTYDGAIPCGQSVMLHNLLDLHELTGDRHHLDRAARLLIALSGAIAESPVGSINSTRALLRLLTAGLADPSTLFPPGTPAAAPPEPGPPADLAPVAAYASTDRIVVGPDQPASFHLRVVIKDGYHVNAAHLGDAAAGLGLVPFRIHAIGGQGLAVYADYPEGEPYGVDNELRVYRGAIEMRVAVEAHGAPSGRPRLAMTYQACTDTACLRPSTVELAVAIDRLG